MMTPICEAAYNELLQHGKGLFKFITPNEVVYSQSHQSGFYIPKAAAYLFTPQGIEKGVNHTHPTKITWQDGAKTSSNLKWYGKGTRSEYRLTGFGRAFPYANNPDLVGDLLILVPTGDAEVHAYLLDSGSDQEELLATLGVYIERGARGGSYAVYDQAKPSTALNLEDACLSRKSAEIIKGLNEMPTGRFFSDNTLRIVKECIQNFEIRTIDSKLILLLTEEFSMFKMAERKIFSPEIDRVFSSVNDFVHLALRILNARKSRAGRSFENHVEYLLREAGVKFEMRAPVPGKPDVLIPGAAEYNNSEYPVDQLFVLGLKTTCKDRWRQVLAEAPRVNTKHLLTLQEGVSDNQVREMSSADVQLVVPSSIHKAYPRESQSKIWSVERFVHTVKQHLDHG